MHFYSTGDSLYYHNGNRFSTPDQDQDETERNCAKNNGAAWWYKSCGHYVRLNGQHYDASSIKWYHFNNSYSGLKTSTMMIIPM